MPYSNVYEPQPSYYGFAEFVTIIPTTAVINIKNESLKTNNSDLQFSFSMVCTYEEDNIDVFLKVSTTSNSIRITAKSVLATQDNEKTTKHKGVRHRNNNILCLEKRHHQRLAMFKFRKLFFYNQKNLFEIFMDIGKYIHARLKARFGSNNRQEMSGLNMEKTEQPLKTAKHHHIFNK